MKEQAAIVIVGGGAAGLMAAIGAGSTLLGQGQSVDVLVIDAARRPGDKIYATGNGRCNLTNLCQGDGCYYTDSDVDPYVFLPGDNAGWLMRFFEDSGVFLHERNGYVYPQTDQAGTIVRVLLRQLRILGVRIWSGCRVRAIKYQGGHYDLDGENMQTRAPFKASSHAVILCTGGMVNASYGCCGDGFMLAERFGHRIVSPLPALCALKSPQCSGTIAGARVDGIIRLFIEEQEVLTQIGSLQLTDYGISGIPAFNVSHLAGRALERGQKVRAVLDLVPDVSAKEWNARVALRNSQIRPDDTLRDVFEGTVNNRIISWLLQEHGLVPESKVKNLVSDGVHQGDRNAALERLFQELRHLSFSITGIQDYDHAQVCAGGVSLSDIDPSTMESRQRRGLYLAGELLDADGICGGYNLTFAMETGYRAGAAAAAMLKGKP